MDPEKVAARQLMGVCVQQGEKVELSKTLSVVLAHYFASFFIQGDIFTATDYCSKIARSVVQTEGPMCSSSMEFQAKLSAEKVSAFFCHKYCQNHSVVFMICKL